MNGERDHVQQQEAMMPEGKGINAGVLEPLFETWREPVAHRVRAERAGEPARRVPGRRPSPLPLVQNLRAAVREWRESYYAGASDTTRHLLNHWFGRSHRRETAAGEAFEFRYYFCQREAIETAIYLKEVRRVDGLSQLVAAFQGGDAEVSALGVTEEEDAWTRYAFKMATGSGKTKVMSLAIVWSYFHALRESESDLARHFVIIAPNLTVYERLKEDFGGGRIFDEDPLIPSEWRGDWNVTTVLQDEAGGAVTGGAVYLTNIHRLYDTAKRRARRDGETYGWMGPAVARGGALDTGAALRERVTGHPRVLVLNDEAHHVWDPGSAWHEAIRYLHETIAARTGGGLAAQLDFTATPKDNKGQPFKHIVCDTPLGEAVDAGIVKTPVIGRADRRLALQPSDNAAYKYEMHLRLGYERWKASRREWQAGGKKPLLFVMCENTREADQITVRFNTDPVFEALNGATINLHTNLKGRLKKVGRGAEARMEFVEDEQAISDEDLRVLRRLSRELDANTSPYHCIVSVLMLREGWDVRNVTTIVPLRPYSSKANILPEQTLGRGLRRMTPPGQAHEMVTVVEHPSFASLYQQELAQEGLPLEIVDVERVPATTISIYPDAARKDVEALEIRVPALSAGHRMRPRVEGLTMADVRKAFARYTLLPLGGRGGSEIDYEGRHLFTNEVVERTRIHLPLLESGVGAVSYFVKQMEAICRVPGLHPQLAPLVKEFLETCLFDRATDLFDPALVGRLGDSDVGEHVRAVFVPLIRARTTTVETRVAAGEPMRLSRWKPFQVTHSERRPALEAARTLFNLAPCNQELEVALARFADRAPDVAAFAKNAGPQCLRIDYLAAGGRLAFYTPDFMVRTTEGRCYLVETKGREDRDVPRKARAAIAWCDAASASGTAWDYLYVPQGVFERLTGDTMAELARMCAPALHELVREEERQAEAPLFAWAAAADEKAAASGGMVEDATLEALRSRYRRAVDQAILLFRFLANKPGMNFGPVFNTLLGCMDEAAKGLILRRLSPGLPAAEQEQKAWLAPYLEAVEEKERLYYQHMAQNLKRTLVFKSGFSPLGLLRGCLDYALNEGPEIGGVFAAVRGGFQAPGDRELLGAVTHVNRFRNTYVAHQQMELTDAALARDNLRLWVKTLAALSAP
jgi:type III restriction enzyme